MLLHKCMKFHADLIHFLYPSQSVQCVHVVFFALGGKSAILTALIVGLGGKAQTTNRGSSLKGFVKEGERYLFLHFTVPSLIFFILYYCFCSFFLQRVRVNCKISSAEISITMRNQGKDAYKPEVFGQSIIVDLRISSEGLRTYKLKSKTGRPSLIKISPQIFDLMSRIKVILHHP